MLSQKEIYDYALKGISAEIERLERDIRQGYRYIEQIDKGEKVTTPKTKLEIIEICRKKKAEIERLDKEKSDIKWYMAVEMKN